MNAIPPRSTANVRALPGGRQLPHNIEAEQALLGAALMNADAYDMTADIAGPDDFFDPVHARLWCTIGTLRADGGAVTMALLKAAFGTQATEELAPGRTLAWYVSQLGQEAASVVSAPDYAKVIRQLADRRRIIEACAEAADRAYAGADTKPTDIASAAIQGLDAVASSAAPAHSKAIDLGGATEDALAKCEAIADRRAKPFEISWGLRSFNLKSNGLEPGDFVVIGGRPSMGKSTLGLSLALDQAKSGQGTYFVSLEMTGQQLGQRALSWRAFNRLHNPVTYKDLRGGNVTQEQREVLHQANEDLRHYPLIVEQEGGLTIGQISARARKHKVAMERAGRPLRTMWVDHLGIIRPTDRYKGQRVQEVTEFTGALKALAKELGITIVALCQLSRATESRDDKRPTLADFRDSGSIEQDTDIVIGVYRSSYYLERKSVRTPEEDEEFLQTQNRMEAIFLKQRQGDTGAVLLYASMPANYICDLDSRGQ